MNKQQRKKASAVMNGRFASMVLYAFMFAGNLFLFAMFFTAWYLTDFGNAFVFLALIISLMNVTSFSFEYYEAIKANKRKVK